MHREYLKTFTACSFCQGVILPDNKLIQSLDHRDIFCSSKCKLLFVTQGQEISMYLHKVMTR